MESVKSVSKEISDQIEVDFKKALEGPETVPPSFCWRFKRSKPRKGILFVEVVMLNDIETTEGSAMSSIGPAFDQKFFEENKKW